MCSFSDATEEPSHANGDIKLIALWIIVLFLVLCCSRYLRVPSAPASVGNVYYDEYEVYSVVYVCHDRYKIDSDVDKIYYDEDKTDSDVDEVDSVTDGYDGYETGREMEMEFGTRGVMNM